MVDVLDSFPALAEIDEPTLQKQVRDCWVRACEEMGVDDLESVPWLPPTQRALDITDESLVGHVRDVVASARGLADALEQSRGTDVDHDLLIAGALVHDVSKLYEFHGTERTRSVREGRGASDESEFHGMEATATYELLGHPYYGVHAVAAVGLPVEYAHVVLSHSSRTTVEPAFLEAELIRRADEAAAAAVRLTAVDDLRDA